MATKPKLRKDEKKPSTEKPLDAPHDALDVVAEDRDERLFEYFRASGTEEIPPLSTWRIFGLKAAIDSLREIDGLSPDQILEVTRSHLGIRDLIADEIPRPDAGRSVQLQPGAKRLPDPTTPDEY